MTTKRKALLSFTILVVVTGIYLLIATMPSEKKLKKQLSSYNLEIYKIEQGWAYKILKNDKNYIIQEYIPGIPGEKKFSSKHDATICGELVISKISKKDLPAISKQELDSIGIFY